MPMTFQDVLSYWYNRKDVVRYRKKINDKIIHFETVAKKDKTKAQQKALEALNPRSKDFMSKVLKESDAEVDKLYSERTKSIGVNILQIELAEKNVVDLMLKTNSEFLGELFRVLDKEMKNRSSSFQQLFTHDELKIVEEALNKIEIVEGKARVKSHAELFEKVDFEYNGELAESAKATMTKIKQHLYGKAGAKVAKKLFLEDGFSLSKHGILNLMMRAVNQNIVAQAVLGGQLENKVMNKGEISMDKALLGRAEKFKYALSSEYPEYERCTKIAQAIYGSPILDNQGYMDLFVIFDVATAGYIRNLVQSESDLDFDSEEGSPDKVINIINRFTNNSLTLSEALNIVKQASLYTKGQTVRAVRPHQADSMEQQVRKVDGRSASGYSKVNANSLELSKDYDRGVFRPR